MIRNLSIRFVCFLSIWLLLIAFVGLSQASQGFSGNKVYLTLGAKTVGGTTTVTIFARNTDHTGAPISPLQILAVCNACLPVGIAPFLNGNSLIILTENILNGKISLEELIFTLQPNNTWKLKQSKLVPTPTLNDAQDPGCFQVTQSGTQAFLEDAITLTGSRVQVVLRPFDAVNGRIGPTIVKRLPPTSVVFTNQIPVCDYASVGGKLELAEVTLNNGVYTVHLGRMMFNIVLPTNESIAGFAISKQNELNPALPGLMLYSVVTQTSTGLMSQPFTQVLNLSTGKTVGNPTPITTPSVFKGGSIDIFHWDSISVDPFVATIGFGLGHTNLTSTPLNQSTGKKAGASRTLGKISQSGIVQLGVWVVGL